MCMVAGFVQTRRPGVHFWDLGCHARAANGGDKSKQMSVLPGCRGMD